MCISPLSRALSAEEAGLPDAHVPAPVEQAKRWVQFVVTYHGFMACIAARLNDIQYMYTYYDLGILRPLKEWHANPR